MNIAAKRKLLIEQLDEHLKILDKAMKALTYSHRKCSTIATGDGYDLEEQESFEALASRFARASDILTQKVFRTILALLQEDARTMIDTANFFEKLELVSNADDLLNIREIRNQIAHEYVETAIYELFRDVQSYVPELEQVIDNVKAYCQETFGGID